MVTTTGEAKRREGEEYVRQRQTIFASATIQVFPEWMEREGGAVTRAIEAEGVDTAELEARVRGLSGCEFQVEWIAQCVEEQKGEKG